MQRDALLVEGHPLVRPEGERDVEVEPLSWNLLRLRGDGKVYLDTTLQHRRGNHENDEKHQHHVDQWDDIDLGQCRSDPAASLMPPAGIRRRSHDLGHQVKFLSAMFRNSREKSSMTAESSFTRWVRWL